MAHDDTPKCFENGPTYAFTFPNWSFFAVGKKMYGSTPHWGPSFVESAKATHFHRFSTMSDNFLQLSLALSTCSLLLGPSFPCFFHYFLHNCSIFPHFFHVLKLLVGPSFPRFALFSTMFFHLLSFFQNFHSCFSMELGRIEPYRHQIASWYIP